MSYEEENTKLLNEAPSWKDNAVREKERAYKARKNPAENHPNYSHKDKLSALTKILQGKS